MTRDVVIFICNNHEDIQRCLVNIPRNRLFTRFFLYLGDKKIDSAKSIITDKDMFLSLQGIDDKKTIIRAGILYSNGWGILFINANNLPTEDDIVNYLNIMSVDGKICNEYVVGATKEWMTFHGFDILFLDTSNNVPTINESEIGLALSGKEVSKEVILYAVCEIISNESFSIDSSLQGDHFFEFWRDCSAMMKSLDDDLPNTIAISSNIPISTMHNAMNKLEEDGSIVMAADLEHSQWWQKHIKPVSVLKCKDGFEILIFEGKTPIIKNQYLSK